MGFWSRISATSELCDNADVCTSHSGLLLSDACGPRYFFMVRGKSIYPSKTDILFRLKIYVFKNLFDSSLRDLETQSSQTTTNTSFF